MACCEEVKPTCGSDSGEVTDNVKEYYGKTLKERNELKTGICLLNWSAPPSIRAAISLVHEEITKRYYGCGLPFPEAVDGCNVLDLGSGTGRDAFVFSKLVGPDGRVVGVDMIQGQLDIANQYVPYHMEKFGFDSPNVEFKKGYLEYLQETGVPDDFFDIVVSNCVINLCEDKKKVLGEAFRAMKAGGEIFFSDVYASKQKPEEAKADKEAWGEGLAGALYWKDLHQLCKELGFSTPVFVTAKAFPVRDERLMKLFDGIEFVSATYRIFKPNPTVDRIPASVVYKGTIVDNADSFKFAKGIEFLTGQSAEVDSELACILKSSRYAKHFDFGPVPSDTTDLLKQVGEENPFCCS